MDKDKLKQIATKALFLEKTDKLGLAKTFIELEEKIDKVEDKVKEAVAEVKQSEVSLDKVLESIKGKDGETGLQGEQGIQGERGEKGEKGDKGDTGAIGKQGERGINGKDGQDGLDGQNGLNGADGSPDTRQQIVEKINTGGKKDLKIELVQLEGTEKLEKGILDRAVSILDQRTKFLINKGVKHDATLSGEGTDASPLTVVGGGGGSVSVDGSEVTDPNFVSTGDIDFVATGSDITANLNNDVVGLDELSATGTPSSSTYLRGDNTWATIAGGGDVSKVGTPVNNQVGVWTGDGTLEGDAALTFDTTTNTLATEIVTVTDDAYGAGWNGSTAVPTKNAVYDKIETLVGGGVSESLAIAYSVAL